MSLYQTAKHVNFFVLYGVYHFDHCIQIKPCRRHSDTHDNWCLNELQNGFSDQRKVYYHSEFVEFLYIWLFSYIICMYIDIIRKGRCCMCKTLVYVRFTFHVQTVFSTLHNWNVDFNSKIVLGNSYLLIYIRLNERITK